MVVFAGAGVSCGAPAYLPTFSELAQEIAQGTDATCKPEETEDQFLGRLQQQGVHVHELAKEALNKRCPRPTDLHRDLLRIYLSSETPRIVTTNFDLLFEKADELGSGDLKTEVFRAPALPLGRKFNGIVHLHGALDRPVDMVLTDADFGRAYLTEGWARRFLVELFRSFTVLFVGYSHRDIVMSYLARALLPSETNRFVLTDEKADRWERLGITPIPFAKSDDYGPLYRGIDKLATYASLGILDWRILIAEHARKPPPRDEDAAALLDEALLHEDRTRFFTSTATHPEWIDWLDRRHHLDGLFEKSAELGPYRQELARWLGKKFALQHAEALWLLLGRHDMQVHQCFWHELAVAVGSSSKESLDKDTLSRWVAVLLATAPVVAPGFILKHLADRCIAQSAIDSIVDIFAVVTKLRLRIAPSLAALYTKPDDETVPVVDTKLEAVSADYRYTSQHIWEKGLRPNIAQVAQRLVGRVAAHLEALHRFQCTWLGGSREWDPLSDRRRAIESEQGDSWQPEIHNVLIDVVRDCIGWLAETRPSVTAQWCEQLAGSDAPILRRLAIHCVTQRDDLDPDQKVDCLLQHSNLSDWSARHELFHAVPNMYAAAGAERRQAVIAAIIPSRWPSAGEDHDYQIASYFSWLEQIHEAAPDCGMAEQALAELRRQYPNFAWRADTGFGHRPKVRLGLQSPWEPQELLSTPPREWLTKLLSFQQTDPIGPDRRGLLEAVQRATTQNFDWGLELADALLRKTEWSSDLWDSILNSWAATELNMRQFETILRTLGRRKLHVTQARRISRILNAAARTVELWRDSKVTRQADGIASHLWNALTEEGIPNHCDDWWNRAINHPAGILAEFWISRMSNWLKEDTDPRVTRKKYRARFSKIVQDQTAVGALGRSVIAHHISSIVDADESWVRNNLLPLFLRNSNKRDYQAVWDGFLNGTIDPPVAELLREAFLDAVTPINDELACESRRRRFIERYTWMLWFVVHDPVVKWIPKLFNCLTADELVRFAQQVHGYLAGMNDAPQANFWSRWLKRYWCNRVQGVPVALQPREIWEMVRWLPSLRRVFSEAVDVAILMPKIMEPDPGNDITVRLFESDLNETCPEDVARLLVYLDGCDNYRGWHRGKELVDKLLRFGLPPELKNGLEELVARRGW